jgi:hypothetical protein
MAHMIPLGFRQGTETEAERRASRVPAPCGSEDEDGSAAPIRLTGIESRTRVTTAFGEVPAHLLRVNDTVRAADGRFHKIRRIDVIRFEAASLRSLPDAYPIRIQAGALRAGVPARDIYLAPEQELLVTTGGAGSKMVRAQELLTRPRVMREPIDQVAYFRLDLGGPASVMAEKVALPVTPPASLER